MKKFIKDISIFLIGCIIWGYFIAGVFWLINTYIFTLPGDGHCTVKVMQPENCE